MKKSFKNDHKKAASKVTGYYTIVSISEVPESESSQWEVLYGISSDKNDLDRDSPIPVEDLKKILKEYFKHEVHPPVFEDEAYKNMYPAIVDSRARAEQLASELVYIFKKAGFEPMTDDRRLYKPQAPKLPRH